MTSFSPIDPLDEAMKALVEWDRQCSELHRLHMDELNELSRCLANATPPGSEEGRDRETM